MTDIERLTYDVVVVEVNGSGLGPRSRPGWYEEDRDHLQVAVRQAHGHGRGGAPPP
jgi:hypothetical protein